MEVTDQVEVEPTKLDAIKATRDSIVEGIEVERMYYALRNEPAPQPSQEVLDVLALADADIAEAEAQQAQGSA